MSIAATNNQNVLIDEPVGNKVPTAKWPVWTSWAFTSLAVLFMLFDAVGKFVMPAPVVEASVRLGFPLSLSVTLGILLSVSTILYAIPRTAVLGAVLLTGYLGGAVAIQMRAGSPLFETTFPVLIGIVIWAGIYLRDCKLRQVFPVRG
jgi:hypothetical protein